MQPTNFLTATETRQQLKDGIITISQILKDHQARYENRDDEVQAWVVARHRQLIEETEGKADINVGENVKQTLDGITIGVKDIISESNWHGTSPYCRILITYRDERHAHEVRLRDLSRFQPSRLRCLGGGNM